MIKLMKSAKNRCFEGHEAAAKVESGLDGSFKNIERRDLTVSTFGLAI